MTYRNAVETDHTAVVRGRKAYVRDAVCKRREFARTCEVWVAPPQDAADERFGNYVCEVFPDGYHAYRTGTVNPVTGAVYHDPSGFGSERVWWPVKAANIDHVRAEHEDMLRECGYVRVL